jgi:L-alanine-DL-glutamate epimerase-like enolase superfamily enzyme
MAGGPEVRVEEVAVSAYRVPTSSPESDGTLEWDHTTLVVVEARGGGRLGLGYTYADTATAHLVADTLADRVRGLDALSPPAAWETMVHAIRNLGRPGIVSMAIAAVDTALWDLKARLLEQPLVTLLGAVRPRVAAYGSGGFTSYTLEELERQLGGWAEAGFRAVKMKVGRDPDDDPRRVRAARAAIGDGVALYVDANGAYRCEQAFAMADRFAAEGVTWFEEPVSSDDLDGLHRVRARAPAGMAVAAGEYGYDLAYFARMLAAGAVDVLQADATRCAGFTDFLRVGALCAGAQMPMSAHTAPSLHTHVACAVPRLRNVEYFHDHVRIESMLLDGARRAVDGALEPDLSRPGLGLELKRPDAARYRVV